jgi:hypothetical protein
MSTILGKIRLLRTTAAACSGVILEEGRLAYFTDEKSLVSGDGTTAGVSLARVGSELAYNVDTKGYKINSTVGGIELQSGTAAFTTGLAFMGSSAGLYAIALGSGTQANDEGAFAGGKSSKANGLGSFSVSAGNVTAAYGGAIKGTCRRIGALTRGWSMTTVFPTGYSQHIQFGLSAKTTDATPKTMTCDGAVVYYGGEDDMDTNIFALPAGTALFGTATICGMLSTGAKACMYIRQFGIKNIADTTSLIGAVQTVGVDIEDDGGYDVTITADNTNDALQINVTGKTSETIRWLACVEGVQMTYGT